MLDGLKPLQNHVHVSKSKDALHKNKPAYLKVTTGSKFQFETIKNMKTPTVKIKKK